MTHVHHHHHTHQHHHVGLTHIGGIHETVTSTARQEIRPQQQSNNRTQQQQQQQHSIAPPTRRRPTSLLQTIKSAPIQHVMHSLIEVSTLPSYCIIPAIKRGHAEIFDRVLGKIDGFDPRTISALINAPHAFLRLALRAGLNVNGWRRRNGDDIATHLSRKYKTLHLKHVLEWEQLELSEAATKMILSDAYQKKTFQTTLFARGMPSTREHMLDALKENNSTSLAHILESLVKQDAKWSDIVDLLTCPITQEVTADLVQTPSRHLYDRAALVNWIKKNQTCPLTRNELYLDDLKERDEILPGIITRIKNL